jgi:hypothetical protein
MAGGGGVNGDGRVHGEEREEEETRWEDVRLELSVCGIIMGR